jgi:hypothetical protein
VAEKYPVNGENLNEISHLSAIWASFPAAEFLAVGRGLAAEIDACPLACS